MINLVEADSTTKVRWKLKIQMLMDKKDIQGFNQVKDSEDFKTWGAEGERGGGKFIILRARFWRISTRRVLTDSDWAKVWNKDLRYAYSNLDVHQGKHLII